ncbi:IS481 family transposase [Acidovorax sp.]|jgi:transposase InsO family protein|uniref:IS481 family transposase n=1 Tax=Acidovorax sp. TaxID=1872122 RepID=UPI002ACEFB60|nr:IS481 family transposase [Acidovorax sp.]MDZ7865249.1 IS481 family transposase [Acidovorax sp.]MDZ7867401.1 IS481 family transposase [Acidovorax sp.]
MPWKACNTMTLKHEFVELARQEGANLRDLCRRFCISPTTAYKWLHRFEQQGDQGLADRSRKPLNSPAICSPEIQAAVIAVRTEHPTWGGRKINWRLQHLGGPAVAPSTINSILKRHGLITPEASEAAKPWQRFERDEPNALWQADFKGYFETLEGRCSPLTMLDDHSRFNLALQACGKTATEVVQMHMTEVFRRYGLPAQINFDNGAPWGSPSAPGQLTALGVWLVQLGIRVSHSRPYHPQTNGKDERFHRTLQIEVLRGRCFESLDKVQQALDGWRTVYNHQRPHEALNGATPVTRYRPSKRAFPEQLSAPEYTSEDEVRTVDWNGLLRFRGRRYKLSSALHRHQVGIRAKPGKDGCFEVFFAHHRCLVIDLTSTDAV